MFIMTRECADGFLYSGLFGSIGLGMRAENHLIQRRGVKVALSIASHD